MFFCQNATTQICHCTIPQAHIIRGKSTHIVCTEEITVWLVHIIQRNAEFTTSHSQSTMTVTVPSTVTPVTVA